MTPLLIGVIAAAEQLGLTEYQVRAEHDRGILPGRRAGRLLRFTQDDLADYLARIAEDKAGAQAGLTSASRSRARRTA